MTTTLWLRIAAVISLLFTAGHTMGGLTQWSPMGDNAVLQQMTTFSLRCDGSEPLVPRLLHGLRLVAQRRYAAADGPALAAGFAGARQPGGRAAADRRVRAGDVRERRH